MPDDHTKYPVPLRQMGCRVEVLPVGCDAIGPVLLGFDPSWRTGLLSADTAPHDVVVRMLGEHGVPAELAPVIHSTSWRLSEFGGEYVMVFTYLVVVDLPKGQDYFYESWPAAISLGRETLEQHHYPKSHGAAEPPIDTRYVDVAHHALGHLLWLSRHNDKVRRALSQAWLDALAGLQEKVALMYDSEANLDVA